MALKFINEDTGVLKTAVFCFTGRSPKTRPEMEAIAINAGAQVSSSVNGRTTILVIADANSLSSKAQSARDRDIDLISPAQFFLMCGSATASNGDGRISQVKIRKPKPVTKPTEKRKHSSVRRIEL
ncbi:MAG: hypothetical protein DRJ03_00070 [Chloroflexi bacterium]|nr:MAG: hypothetical protein DRJ03_00070 [Chloroflexota bacterium]